jgi:hypothetical protein
VRRRWRQRTRTAPQSEARCGLAHCLMHPAPPCGSQTGAAHPVPSGMVRLSCIHPGQQGSRWACDSGWFGSVRRDADQLGGTTAESRPRDVEKACPLVGTAALRIADLAEARQTPAGCPRQASPAGNRLVRGSPGGVWAKAIPYIGGLSLVSEVIPQRLTCSNPTHDGGRPSLGARRANAARPTDPCLQSQIGRHRHLRGCEAVQVDAASVLSVASVDRS